MEDHIDLCAVVIPAGNFSIWWCSQNKSWFIHPLDADGKEFYDDPIEYDISRIKNNDIKNQLIDAGII